MTPAPLTAQPLWTRARAMFARALAAVGDPAAVAALTSLSAALRRRILAWLAPLEHIVRKLLLAEAARLDATPAPKGWSAPPPAAHDFRHAFKHTREARPEAARSNMDASAPNSWRAQFALSLPRDSRVVANAHAPRIRALWGNAPAPAPAPVRRQAPALDGGFRLARRLEALRRVLIDPLPHAARLARLLARAARRFPEIARRYWLSPARSGDYDPQDARLSLDALAFAAAAAASAFEDSS